MRRRDTQGARDIVEAVARVVAWKQDPGVYGQFEKIANRVRVLGAIETVQDGRAGVRVGETVVVERAFEPRGEPDETRTVGAGLARRRHHASAELAHGRLPCLAMARDIVAVERVEGHAACELTFVVATDAVALEQRPLLIGRRWPGPGKPKEQGCHDSQRPENRGAAVAHCGWSAAISVSSSASVAVLRAYVR